MRCIGFRKILYGLYGPLFRCTSILSVRWGGHSIFNSYGYIQRSEPALETECSTKMITVHISCQSSRLLSRIMKLCIEPSLQTNSLLPPCSIAWSADLHIAHHKSDVDPTREGFADDLPRYWVWDLLSRIVLSVRSGRRCYP